MQQIRRRFPVRIDGTWYSANFQAGDNWQSVLKANHRKSHGLCECLGADLSSKLKLAIKHRSDTDTYYLARFGTTGLEHDESCRYYGETTPDGSDTDAVEAAILEAPDGTFRITLGKGIKIAAQATSTATNHVPQRARTARRSKRRSTLLGLLHLLWEIGRLNRWSPAMEGKRNPRLVSYLTSESATSVRVSDIPLSEILLVAAKKGDEYDHSNAETSRRAREQQRRMVAISPLSRFDATRHGDPPQRLPLAGPFGMPTMTLAAGVWEHAKRQFEGAVSAWQRGERVMAVALFDTAAGGSRGQGEVIDLALMRVSEEWIPVESTYELTIEQMLRAQQRRFTKPLRYRSDDDTFHYDFELTDTHRKVPLEVFGMNTPEYLERRAEKIATLDEDFGQDGWWYWDAYADNDGEHIPAFPPARSENNRNE